MQEIIEKAKMLAQEWYLVNFPFFQKIGHQFSWKELGEDSQEYWKQQVNNSREE